MNNINGTKPLFKINGVDFPTPNSGFNIEGQQGVNSQRNANYSVVAQKINRRMIKFNCSWNYLTANQWRVIRQAVENFTAIVTYYDLLKGQVINREFYFGDDSATPFEFDSNNYEVAVPLSYINCSVNLIDMGY